MTCKINTLKKFLFVLFITCFFNNSYSFENRIVLKIDNEIITEFDIHNEMNYLKALNRNLSNLEKNKIYEISKNSLIREKIKELEISKLQKTKIKKEYLEEIIKKIYVNIGLENKEEFIKYIQNFNIDINDIEKKLYIEALWNQIIYQKFYSNLKIDEKKIRQEIESNKENINSFLLYEIVFRADKSSEMESLFSKIQKSIEENGFENTASIYSTSDTSKVGGKLGWIDENTMSKKIQLEISKLEKNQYTKPILIPGGFIILFVKNKKKIEKKIDLEKEVALKIAKIKNQQLNQYSNIYFSKIKKDILINEK